MPELQALAEAAATIRFSALLLLLVVAAAALEHLPN
jgi:hypothetical protein